MREKICKNMIGIIFLFTASMLPAEQIHMQFFTREHQIIDLYLVCVEPNHIPMLPHHNDEDPEMELLSELDEMEAEEKAQKRKKPNVA